MFKLKINKAKLETGGNCGTQKQSCGHCEPLSQYKR